MASLRASRTAAITSDSGSSGSGTSARWPSRSTRPRSTSSLREWRRTLSASACNNRRNALTNRVKVPYGRGAAGGLVDIIRFRLPAPRPRWLPRSHMAEVLAQLTPGSKTAVRLRLMYSTGMRPSRMGRLREEDFRFAEPRPFVVVPRGKRGRLAAIYAPPELEKHVEAIERLRRADATSEAVSCGKRLAEPAGRETSARVSY